MMYGQEHGLLIAVARGASSPRSKQAGHLEPFSAAEVMIANGRAFDTLAVAIGVKSQKSKVKSPLPFYVILGAFSDLIIKLTRPGIADERIFFLLQEAIETLANLSEPPSPERARFIYAAATLRLLDCVGFAPHLDQPLLVFMRRAPLADLLRVTAMRGAFIAACAFVEDALEHTPLEGEPHGGKTVASLLGAL